MNRLLATTAVALLLGLAPALAACAETLAGTESVWLGRDGDAANKFLSALAEHGDALGAVSRHEAPRLIS